MADTAVSAANQVSQWENKFFVEYVRDNLFSPYMGTNENAVIQVLDKLTSNRGGDSTISLVTRLTGSGVTGNTKLEDAEEALDNYGHKIDVEYIRNGVLITDREQQRTQIELLNAARTVLMNWSLDDTRDKTILAMQSVATADGENIAYASASEANKDAWLANNTDRIIFGSALGNTTGTDHSASLANIDATADKMSADLVSLAKRVAKTADPHIRPTRVNGSEEWFVMFHNSFAFRDLKQDSVMQQANREAWSRGRNNPIFRDGDLLYDGVINREVPEIPTIGLVGTTSASVGSSFLCGAQAVGVEWATRWKTARETRDYGFRRGVAIGADYGIEKLIYNGSQHGMVTVYASDAGDA